MYFCLTFYKKIKFKEDVSHDEWVGCNLNEVQIMGCLGAYLMGPNGFDVRG